MILQSLTTTSLHTPHRMLLSHAPPLPFLLNTILHFQHRHYSRTLFSSPLFSTSHSFSQSRRSSTLPMNGVTIATDDSSSTSSPEQITGDWSSVPSLRLRDHRFTVPLDYSRGLQSSPKITVFAREVVAGNSCTVSIVVAWRFNIVDFFVRILRGEKKWNFDGD